MLMAWTRKVTFYGEGTGRRMVIPVVKCQEDENSSARDLRTARPIALHLQLLCSVCVSLLTHALLATDDRLHDPRPMSARSPLVS